MVRCWQTGHPIEPTMEVNKLEKFLKFEKCRLKFDAYWDNRTASAGDIHDLAVYYYLYDDTVQINEIPKNGRPFAFYSRAKLTKRTEDVLRLHTRSNPDYIGYLTMSTIRIRDKHNLPRNPVDYYKETDLKIGQTLNVFGRKVVLINCDQYTRDFYQQVYGIKHFDVLNRPDESDSIHPTVDIAKTLHPWCSFKKPEFNHLTMKLKVKQHKMAKFLQHDNCKLRFKASIEDYPYVGDRNFIITYYLENDTISVYEIGGQNFSSSGEFLKRAKFYMPNKGAFPDISEPYTSQMLYIGAKIDLHRYVFHITDADDFTLNYMESHECDYPMADIDLIMAKIKLAIQTATKNYIYSIMSLKHEQNKLDSQTAIMALRELMGNNISDHEIVTFVRYFSSKKSESLKIAELNTRSKIQTIVHTTLANELWDDLDRLKKHFFLVGQTYPKGFIPAERLRSLMRQAKIPIVNILADKMFAVLNKDVNGNIDYNDFLDFMEGIKSKPSSTRRMLPADPYSGSDKKIFHTSEPPESVDWSAFLAKLGSVK